MGSIFWNERQRLLASGEQVEVLLTGDSWFHYPANNLATPLWNAVGNRTTYVVGENGARADELCAGGWLRHFEQILSDYPGIRLVAISAGGNDFAGVGDLDDKILAADCSAAGDVDDCFRANEPGGVFDVVNAAYRTLIASVARLRPGATILLHNYDYAIPNGRTLLGLRSWLKLPMDNCRVPTPGAPAGGIRRGLVGALIDHFTLALENLEDDGNAGAPKVDLVWSAGTLRDSEWANELHPTPGGFNRIVAQCWAGPARKALGLP